MNSKGTVLLIVCRVPSSKKITISIVILCDNSCDREVNLIFLNGVRRRFGVGDRGLATTHNGFRGNIDILRFLAENV